MSQSLELSLDKLEKQLKKRGLQKIKATAVDESIRLTGNVSEWRDKVEAGYLAASFRCRGVLNDITVDDVAEDRMRLPEKRDKLLHGRSFDAVIVGGGVVGCAIARELSKQNITIAVIEKESDLAMQASGRNDGMIHPGFAASPGTKKAAYNVRGNRMYSKLSMDLDFELKRPGSIILLKSGLMKALMPIFRLRCKKNGVDGDWRSLSAAEVKRLEPNVTSAQKGGFILPSAGIVSPYRVTIAFAENAVDNGAEIFLDTAVTAMKIEDGKISEIETNRGNLRCGVLINAAGVWADKLAEMAGDRFFSIHGRKGTDAILDSSCAPFQNHILGMPSLLGAKNSHSKGGGLVPCVEGNILLGPTAEEVAGREDYSTDFSVFENLLKQLSLNSKLSESKIINYYSGVRAANWKEDFIIEPSQKIGNLVYAAAIQSPGLASAPAIAEDVAVMAVAVLEKEGVRVKLKKDFNPKRVGIPKVKNLCPEERSALINKDPAYGEILCRCEEISRGEIRDALRSPVPATTVDGIKRRVRAGAGRCHGGFCLPRVIKTMADELGVQVEDITKNGGSSQILCCRTKEEMANESAS